MTTFAEKYNYYMHEIADSRTQDWFMISSPFPVLGVVFAYIYIIYVAGPRYMQDRKPYDLKKIIAIYNIFQVIACGFTFYYTLTSGWLTTYTLGCVPTDYSDSPEAMRMTRAVFYVFLLKFVDLIETVFFVLRKKHNQVSFLHVYHHISTFLLGWVGVKYIAGGMATFSVLPNSLVHMIMYTYYFLALGGPEVQKKLLFWKQSLTLIQMIQFTIILIHSLQALSPECNVPKELAWFYIPNVGLIYYLFYDFYKKAYSKKEA